MRKGKGMLRTASPLIHTRAVLLLTELLLRGRPSNVSGGRGGHVATDNTAVPRDRLTQPHTDLTIHFATPISTSSLTLQARCSCSSLSTAPYSTASRHASRVPRRRRLARSGSVQRYAGSSSRHLTTLAIRRNTARASLHSLLTLCARDPVH